MYQPYKRREFQCDGLFIVWKISAGIMRQSTPLTENDSDIIATYGLRRSEVCGLRWDAVDFDAGVIHVRHTAVVDNGNVIYADHTKTATSDRLLPLTLNMRTYLLKVKRRQEADRELLGSAVYALRKDGCDAKDIQAWLGHSDITTTLNVYGHVAIWTSWVR